MRVHKIITLFLIILLVLSLIMQYVVDKSTTEGLIKYGISQIDTVILSMTLILLGLCGKKD